MEGSSALPLIYYLALFWKAQTSVGNRLSQFLGIPFLLGHGRLLGLVNLE